MKRFAIFSLASALLIGFNSCSSMKNMESKRDGDDVYYSSADAKKDRLAEQKRLEMEQKQKEEDAKQAALDQQTADARSKPGSDYYDEKFDYDDYYDYEYATRLRRFDHPVNGYGYYDNYYTNSYFYNGNPYSYGTSIYYGYNFWGPTYYAYNYNPSSFWYWNNGWGWGIGCGGGWGQPWGSYYDPWSPWGYSPYYPSYGYGYGYGYPYGYNSYGGGYGGYQNNYYNSFDGNSNYYGPRNSPTASDGRVVGSGGPTFGERFEQAIATENHMDNPTREQINRVVGVPPAASATVNTGNTEAGRNNNTRTPAGTYNSGSTISVPQNPNNVGRTPTYGGNTPATRGSTTPATQEVSRPSNNTSTAPSTTRPDVSTPPSRNNEPVSRPHSEAPQYHAPASEPGSRPRSSEMHVERSSPSSSPAPSRSSSGGGGRSSSGGGGSRPR